MATPLLEPTINLLKNPSLGYVDSTAALAEDRPYFWRYGSGTTASAFTVAVLNTLGGLASEGGNRQVQITPTVGFSGGVMELEQNLYPIEDLVGRTITTSISLKVIAGTCTVTFQLYMRWSGGTVDSPETVVLASPNATRLGYTFDIPSGATWARMGIRATISVAGTVPNIGLGGATCVPGEFDVPLLFIPSRETIQTKQLFTFFADDTDVTWGGVPEGFKLLDGTGGDPDLTGRTIISKDGVTFVNTGDTGGDFTPSITLEGSPNRFHQGVLATTEVVPDGSIITPTIIPEHVVVLYAKQVAV